MRHELQAKIGLRRFAPMALVAFALSACNPGPASSPGPSVGSNSNWLTACGKHGDCAADGACLCGACSAKCASDADCEALSGAHCVVASDPAASTSCGATSPPSGMCLPRCMPGGCGAGQVCVEGSCVLTPLPQNAFCDGAAEPSATDRSKADELLALFQAERTGGMLDCGAGPVSAPALRVDPRLLCEARVFASDLAVTRARSLTDSQGRQPDARLRLAGYVPKLWSEDLAVRATGAEVAWQIMLGDSGACMRFTDPRYTDVGMASTGDVMVLTLAAGN